MKKLTMILVLILSFGASAKGINYDRSLSYLLDNIHPEGTLPGVVVASPSTHEPNYFYHWVRDAALVMNTIFDIFEKESDPTLKEKLKNKLKDYAKLVQTHQKNSGFNHLGEPKYFVTGMPYTGPWGRPQNDGPALRAITLIKFANYLIANGEKEWVINNLYKSELPATSPIKQDLEFVSYRFEQIGFDYWEEIKGLHFSTAMGQRRALLMGAQLAKKLNDQAASNWYFLQAKKTEQVIERFWNPSKGFIQATIDQQGGFYKSQLDISSILGVHHGAFDELYNVQDKRVLKTVKAIELSFKKLYSINSQKSLGVAIGRYPEDTYDGYHTNSEGHAWFLATFAMAEFHLRLKNSLEKTSHKKWNMNNLISFLNIKVRPGAATLRKIIIGRLQNKANKYFSRADFHSGENGRMSEQMNRHTGFMEGAKNLTWSYASHLSALLQKK